MNELTELLGASSILLIVLAMNVYGSVLKILPWPPNDYIPLILAFSGAAGYMGLEGLSVRNGIIGFVVAGLAPIGVNKIFRQITDSQEENSLLRRWMTNPPKPK